MGMVPATNLVLAGDEATKKVNEMDFAGMLHILPIVYIETCV